MSTFCLFLGGEHVNESAQEILVHIALSKNESSSDPLTRAFADILKSNDVDNICHLSSLDASAWVFKGGFCAKAIVTKSHELTHIQ